MLPDLLLMSAVFCHAPPASLGFSAPQTEVYRAPPVLLEATVPPPANHFAPPVLLEATVPPPANQRASSVPLVLATLYPAAHLRQLA